MKFKSVSLHLILLKKCPTRLPVLPPYLKPAIKETDTMIITSKTVSTKNQPPIFPICNIKKKQLRAISLPIDNRRALSLSTTKVIFRKASPCINRPINNQLWGRLASQILNAGRRHDPNKETSQCQNVTSSVFFHGKTSRKKGWVSRYVLFTFCVYTIY